MEPAKYQQMHLSLYVSDLEASKNFYSTLFGQQPVKEKADYLKYDIAEPAMVVSFVLNASKAPQAFPGHLGFTVSNTNALTTVRERLEAAGLPMRIEDQTACCYALQDKLWVQDPDGNPWEVYHFQGDLETESIKPDTEMVLEEAEASCVPGSGCC